MDNHFKNLNRQWRSDLPFERYVNPAAYLKQIRPWMTSRCFKMTFNDLKWPSSATFGSNLATVSNSSNIWWLRQHFLVRQHSKIADFFSVFKSRDTSLDVTHCNIWFLRLLILTQPLFHFLWHFFFTGVQVRGQMALFWNQFHDQGELPVSITLLQVYISP